MVTHNEDGTTRDVGFLYVNSDDSVSGTSVPMEVLELMERGVRLFAENDLMELTAGVLGSGAPTLTMFWNAGRNEAVVKLTGLPTGKTFFTASGRSLQSIRASAYDIVEPICVTRKGDIFLFDTLWLIGGRLTSGLFLNALHNLDDADLECSTPISWLLREAVTEVKGNPDAAPVKHAIADAKLRGLDDTFGYKLLEFALDKAKQLAGGG